MSQRIPDARIVAVQASLTPTDNPAPDTNIYCRRATGKLYAVLTAHEWCRLREKGQLEKHLESLR